MDQKMFEEAGCFFDTFLEQSQTISELSDQAAHTKWNPVVTEIIYRSYYTKVYKKLRPKIKKQYLEAKSFYNSDICHRETRIRYLIGQEIQLLHLVLEIDPIKYLINGFFYLINELFPMKNKKEKCIMVSLIMHDLEIFDQAPFLTLDEANEIAKANMNKPEDNRRLNIYNTEGSTIIYNRIKKYIEKDFVLIP